MTERVKGAEGSGQVMTLEQAIQARYDLERAMLGEEEWEITVDGEPRGRIDRQGMEWGIAWGKLLFQWWKEEETQQVRVIWHRIEPGWIRLKGIWGLGQSPLRIELTSRGGIDRRGQEKDRSVPLALLRPGLSERLAAALRRALPDGKVLRITTGPDRPRAIPGHYSRAMLERRGETILARASGPWEDQAAIDGIVASGLVWLEQKQSRSLAQPMAGKPVREVWFIVPAERSMTLWERIPMLSGAHLGCRFRCFELDEAGDRLIPVEPVTQGELFHRHPRDLTWPNFVLPPAGWAEHSWHHRILALAPGRIEGRYRPGPDWTRYLIEGLEFARVPRRRPEAATFGVVGDPMREGRPLEALSERAFGSLQRLVASLLEIRRAETRDRRHPFYRLREEAWLESMLRRRIEALDPTLDPGYVYSQIPTWRVDERSVIDLMTVRREGPDRGRIVVIEIKTSEDLQLPLQGLDYWLRVEQARRRGELSARGLFRGADLVDRPAILYLVAPRLRFHRGLATLARCLHPEIEGYRVGLNTNWREGIRVHSVDRLQEL